MDGVTYTAPTDGPRGADCNSAASVHSGFTQREAPASPRTAMPLITEFHPPPVGGTFFMNLEDRRP